MTFIFSVITVSFAYFLNLIVFPTFEFPDAYSYKWFKRFGIA